MIRVMQECIMKEMGLASSSFCRGQAGRMPSLASNSFGSFRVSRCHYSERMIHGVVRKMEM